MMAELLMTVLRLLLGLAQLSRTGNEDCCLDPAAAKSCATTELCRRHVWGRPAAAPRLAIAGYIESLCPDTRRWIINQLYPAWQAVGPIMDVTLMPYGKATQHPSGGRWQFTCQHGPQECVGNLIFTCAIRIYKDVAKWLPFIYCVEHQLQQDIRQTARACAAQHAIDYNTVYRCATNKTGNQWEHEVGVATEQLRPPLNYVPWMTLDGKHNTTIQKRAEFDLLKFLCDSYTGRKPSGCLQRYLLK